MTPCQGFLGIMSLESDSNLCLTQANALIRSMSEVQLPKACGKVWPTLFPCCPQPPLVKTQTVTISDTANAVKSEIPTKDVPIVHTETKTITYEAAQVRC